MDAYAAQTIGRRANQEDSYGIKHFPTGTLAIICDGMGGHALGDRASRVAVDAFLEVFEVQAGVTLREALLAALMHANICVGDIFIDSDVIGGCTLVAAYVTKSSITWVSVGDSPLFLWRANRLIRLNADHSMRSVFSDLTLPGSSYTDAAQRGHMLRSALTGEDITLIDLSRTPYPLLPRDRVILASDGVEDLLYLNCLTADTEASLNDPNPNLAVRLVEANSQLDAPFADNCTVISLDI
ncbi:MAG: protein phosphatase 2C domain-containing protein [Akkermansia sp.]